MSLSECVYMERREWDETKFCVFLITYYDQLNILCWMNQRAKIMHANVTKKLFLCKIALYILLFSIQIIPIVTKLDCLIESHYTLNF